MSEANRIALSHWIISADAEYGMNEEELLACVETIADRTASTLADFGDLLTK